jgi:hypothetical protein
MLGTLAEQAKLNAIVRRQQLSALEGQRKAAAAVRNLPRINNPGTGLRAAQAEFNAASSAMNNAFQGSALGIGENNMGNAAHELRLEMAMRGNAPPPQPRGVGARTLMSEAELHRLAAEAQQGLPSGIRTNRRVAPAPPTGPRGFFTRRVAPIGGPAAPPPNGWLSRLFTRRGRVVPIGGPPAAPAAPAAPPRGIVNRLFGTRVASMNHLNVMDKISELTDKLLSVHQKIEAARDTEALRKKHKLKPIITKAQLEKMESEYDFINEKLDNLIELSNVMMTISRANKARIQADLDVKLNKIINEIEALTNAITKDLDNKEGGRRITRKRR